MRRDGVAEDVGEVWTLGPADLALTGGLPDAGRLGLAAQLAHWRAHGRFPDDEADLPPAAVGRLAAQLGVDADALEAYDWSGRTGRRHRRLILDHLAVAAFDEAAEARFRRWLAEELLPRELVPSAMDAESPSLTVRRPLSCPRQYRPGPNAERQTSLAPMSYDPFRPRA